MGRYTSKYTGPEIDAKLDAAPIIEANPTVPSGTATINLTGLKLDSNYYSLFSGSYNDLTNKPTIPAAQVNADWNASSGVAQILNKPSLFSGSYNDLTDKPTLFSGSYNDLTNKPTIPNPSTVYTNAAYVSIIDKGNISSSGTETISAVVTQARGSSSAHGKPFIIACSYSGDTSYSRYLCFTHPRYLPPDGYHDFLYFTPVGGGPRVCLDLDLYGSQNLYETFISRTNVKDAGTNVIRIISGATASPAGVYISNIATRYTMLRVHGYNSVVPEFEFDFTLDIATLVAGGTITKKLTITGWQDPLNVYFYPSDNKLGYDSGGNGTVYLTLVEGIQ